MNLGFKTDTISSSPTFFTSIFIDSGTLGLGGLEAGPQLLLALEISLLFGFKALFAFLFLPIVGQPLYPENSRDYGLLEVIQLFYVFLGLVVDSTIWYTYMLLDTRRKLFNFIKNVLEAEVFDYKDMSKYLDR